MSVKTTPAGLATTFLTAAAIASSTAIVAAALILGVPAKASEGAGSHGHGAPATTAIGQPAKANDADRTVQVKLLDNSFAPDSIQVEPGETVRFAVTNAGTLVHEFSLGSAAMHEAHRGEMMQMMQSGALEADRIDHSKMGNGHGMSHADPNSILLEPGQSGEVIWTFPRSGVVQLACNVPGHAEAGMTGTVRIE